MPKAEVIGYPVLSQIEFLVSQDLCSAYGKPSVRTCCLNSISHDASEETTGSQLLPLPMTSNLSTKHTAVRKTPHTDMTDGIFNFQWRTLGHQNICHIKSYAAGVAKGRT